MKVCLVLLSGLPGAGKTTLSLALQNLQQQQMECMVISLDKSSHYIIDAVLELDAFMNENGKNSEDVFTPELWQKAHAAVREAVHQQLLCSLLKEEEKDKKKGLVIRFVFLVDTLPYRSMRAAYWKICRDINQMQLLQQQQQEQYEENENEKKKEEEVVVVKEPIELEIPSLVSMIEVRLNTPLELCLERNEKRIGTPQYIPVHVIKNMNESFDVGITPSLISVVEENCWMILSPQATPSWPVIQLKDEKRHALLSSSMLADQLLKRLFSSELIDELEKQKVSLVKNEEKRRIKKEHQQKQQELYTLDTLSRKRLFHQLDLRMREVVREHMEFRKKYGGMNPSIGTEVSKCREEHYTWVKAFLTKHETFHSMSVDEKDALVDELLLEFRKKLSEL
ncbi:uncharacterized protein TM35_000081250 [Trypanosoma theileri]|uniref:Uncharacterized protein n=1 Tax=Trypanosoma theileri TaxID=67003 RepID=A0A1X0P061_9TRYP|nr:uncharacterized protein TM35_000081250 [Trypanosoma theileri]ORC90327.1 hypothetical protein TM35_000081250 [Trypanosoma theileri]